jgi:hypothetical protein
MFVDSFLRWASLGAAVTCAGCVGNSAPKGWLPRPVEAHTAAYGGWIELAYQESGRKSSMDGELIAVSADSVWVLNDTQGLVIPTAAVTAGKLTAYEAQTGSLTLWTVGGTLATISNGALLLLTAPMWIIGGSFATGNESRAAQRKTPPLSWVELTPFARFPQGMPDGIELNALQPKQVHRQVGTQP